LDNLKEGHRLEELDGDIAANLRVIGWEGLNFGSLGSGHGPMAGSCEYGNETSGPVELE
jgi:hypothetical protein